MAHALVLKVKFADSWDTDQLKMLEEVVVPLAKSQPGFQRGAWMHDDDKNGIGVVTFASEAQAKTAQSTLTPPPGGPTLVSSSVYEVAAEA